MTRTNRPQTTRTDRADATRDDSTTDRESTPMRDVSHTHPHAERTTVNRPFERGPVVATDGGRRDAGEADAGEGGDDDSEEESPDTDEQVSDDEDSRERERMRDVSHTPPHGEGANRVFERGGEQTGRDADGSEDPDRPGDGGGPRDDEPVASDE